MEKKYILLRTHFGEGYMLTSGLTMGILLIIRIVLRVYESLNVSVCPHSALIFDFNKNKYYTDYSLILPWYTFYIIFLLLNKFKHTTARQIWMGMMRNKFAVIFLTVLQLSCQKLKSKNTCARYLTKEWLLNQSTFCTTDSRKHLAYLTYNN